MSASGSAYAKLLDFLVIAWQLWAILDQRPSISRIDHVLSRAAVGRGACKMPGHYFGSEHRGQPKQL